MEVQEKVGKMCFVQNVEPDIAVNELPVDEEVPGETHLETFCHLPYRRLNAVHSLISSWWGYLIMGSLRAN